MRNAWKVCAAAAAVLAVLLAAAVLLPRELFGGSRRNGRWI